MRVLFDGWGGEGHGMLVGAVWVGGAGRLSMRTGHRPPRVGVHGVTAASRALRTAGVLLSPVCGRTSPIGLSHAHTVCCTPPRPREGGR